MGHYDPLIFTPLPFVRNSIHKELLEKSRKIWYAKTREKCEEKLAELIKTMKAEIAEMKKAANA